MQLQGMHAQSFSPEMLATFRGRFAAGHGTCPVIGTPDEVADEIERFATAGFGGITMSFVDCTGELEHFAAEVMSRLVAKGLRPEVGGDRTPMGGSAPLPVWHGVALCQ